MKKNSPVVPPLPSPDGVTSNHPVSAIIPVQIATATPYNIYGRCELPKRRRIIKSRRFWLGIAVAFLILLASACGGDKKCKFKPEPVFSQNLKTVKQYNFERTGSESLESLFFENGVWLELYQKVCDKTRQEYKFQVQGDFRSFPDSMWMKEAVRQLTYLSTLSEKQAPLREWAGILEANRMDMKLAEEKEVQSGITAKVDRVVNPQQSILLLTFDQK